MRAVVVVLVGIFLLDVMGALVKHLIVRYPAPELAMFRNLFGMVPTLIILVTSSQWRKQGRPLMFDRWYLGFIRGIFVTGAQFCFYVGLAHLELATVSTLVFAGPMFITALSMPILGDRVGLWRWMAVLVGFVGIVLVVRPGSDLFTYHALLPIGAALGYACATILVKLIDDRAPTAAINLYSQIGALGGALVLVATLSGYVPVASLEDMMSIAAMGVVGGMGVFCLISAYRMSRPSNLAPFEYFGIVFAFGLGWVFFDEAPFDKLIPGVFLIVAAGLLIIWRQARHG